MKRVLTSLLTVCFVFVSVIALPASAAHAQFSLLPKLQDDFKKTERAKYTVDGDIISDTKLCSRIFKVVTSRTCKDGDDTIVFFKDGKYTNSDEFIKNEKDCLSKDIQGVLKEFYRTDRKKERDIQKAIANRDKNTESYLACAILSGNVKLWMMPYYVRYMADFVLAVAGPITIIVIIYGGYTYIVGSMGSEGEGAAQGKKIIFAGVLGLVIIFSAWTIVNVVSAVLTG